MTEAMASSRLQPSSPPRRERPLIGAGWAALAACFFTASDVLIRLIEPWTDVWQVVAGRSLFGLLAMLALSPFRRQSILGRQRGVLLVQGLAGAGTFVCLVLSLRSLPMAEALILLYLFPAFAALLAPWLTDDRHRLADWLLIGVAFVGLAVVLWPNNRTDGLVIGHLFGVLSGFCLGLAFTLVRRLHRQGDALSPYFYYCLCGFVGSAAVLILGPAKPWPETSLGWWGLLGVGAVSMLANPAANKSVQHLSAPKAGVVMMLEVVFGAAVGVVVFLEQPTLKLALGAILILGGAAGLIAKPERKVGGSARGENKFG